MRRKLFVIQDTDSKVCASLCLFKGDLRGALEYAQSNYGPNTRVKRVKTPAEFDNYSILDIHGDGFARTEWVN